MKLKVVIALSLNAIVLFVSAILTQETPLLLVTGFIWLITVFPSLVLCAMFRRQKSNVAVGFLASGGPIIMLGFLFRLMHWPGAKIQMIFGGILMFSAIVVFLLMRRRKSDAA